MMATWYRKSQNIKVKFFIEKSHDSFFGSTVAGIADQKHDRAIAVAIPFEFFRFRNSRKVPSSFGKTKNFYRM
jgi:hypothetical protein